MHDTHFQILCTAHSPVTPDIDAQHMNIPDINYFLTWQYFKCHNPHFECHKTKSDIATYICLVVELCSQLLATCTVIA